MAAKKKSKARATEKPGRVRFVGYPFADAYQIQNAVKRNEQGEEEFRRDDSGNKVAVPDKDKPLHEDNDETKPLIKKKAKKNGQLPCAVSKWCSSTSERAMGAFS